MFQQQFVRVWCGCGGSFPLSHYPGGDRVAGYTRSLIGDGVGMGKIRIKVWIEVGRLVNNKNDSRMRKDSTNGIIRGGGVIK